MESKTNAAGEAIEALRKHYNIGRSELAKAVGKDESYIFLIEKGKRPCPEKLVKAIEEFFVKHQEKLRSEALQELVTSKISLAGFPATSAGMSEMVLGRAVKENPLAMEKLEELENSDKTEQSEKPLTISEKS